MVPQVDSLTNSGRYDSYAFTVSWSCKLRCLAVEIECTASASTLAFQLSEDRRMPIYSGMNSLLIDSPI